MSHVMVFGVIKGRLRQQLTPPRTATVFRQDDWFIRLRRARLRNRLPGNIHGVWRIDAVVWRPARRAYSHRS